ncbi:hypothetical protein C8R43DRAFT_1125513 [Mycena crocata]|nr:hypothetical protein C8R43DRAFT_1125513 [Mycena crocata]
MATRRRSFHLNACEATNVHSKRASPTAATNSSLNPQHIEVRAASIGLLALARQASVFTFALLGGCAPGIRQRPKRVQRTLLEGPGGEETLLQLEAGVGMELAVQKAGKTDLESDGLVRDDAETNGPQIQPDTSSRPSPQAKSQNSLKSAERPVEVDDDLPEMVEPQIQLPNNEGSSVLRLSQDALSLPAATASVETPTEDQTIAPLDVGLPPDSRVQLRADLMRKISALTAARISRGPAAAPPPPSPPHPAEVFATPPPRHTAYFDDPFADATSPVPRAQFVPAHPITLCYPSMQRFRADQQESPTPLVRQARQGRPPLLQQTVVYQIQSHTAPRTPPKFWSPHPAGSRSCAIAIKAPPATPRAADKENRAVD